MASRLPKFELSNNESALAWLDIFEAACRHNNVKEEEQRDYFLSLVDIEAYLKLKTIVAPENIVEMKFKKIKVLLTDYLTPRKKLVIAERARFFEIKQLDGECASEYIQRLRKASEYCEFDKLTGEEDIVKLKFISGLCDGATKQKLLEANIDKELTLNESLELVKNIEQISHYTSSSHTFEDHKPIPSTQNFDVDAVKITSEKMITNCRYCGKNHRVRQCPERRSECLIRK